MNKEHTDLPGELSESPLQAIPSTPMAPVDDSDEIPF
jgi:hypothetical protein